MSQPPPSPTPSDVAATSAISADATSHAQAPSTAAQAQSFVKTLIFYVALATLFRIAVFEAFEIEGPSMEPTLLNGDRVVVSKFAYGLFLPFMKQSVLTWGKPKPGEVVIVKSPADNIDIVKRVIGLPGDIIEIRDDVVYRNNKALGSGSPDKCGDSKAEMRDSDCTWIVEHSGDHAYHTSQSISSAVMNYPPVRVPEDHVYILGDHRDRSNDSRFFGPVPINRIKRGTRRQRRHQSAPRQRKWHLA